MFGRIEMVVVALEHGGLAEKSGQGQWGSASESDDELEGLAGGGLAHDGHRVLQDQQGARIDDLGGGEELLPDGQRRVGDRPDKKRLLADRGRGHILEIKAHANKKVVRRRIREPVAMETSARNRNIVVKKYL